MFRPLMKEDSEFAKMANKHIIDSDIKAAKFALVFFAAIQIALFGMFFWYN